MGTAPLGIEGMKAQLMDVYPQLQKTSSKIVRSAVWHLKSVDISRV